MTDTAKMRAQPEPKQVRVRANLAVMQLRRGQEASVTMSPFVQRMLDDGKLSLVDEPKPKPEPKTRKRAAGGNGSV